MTLIRFTIAGYPPRTKKNRSQLVRALGRAVIVPSEQYPKWFKVAMKQALIFQGIAKDAGYELPIKDPVSVRATFYRDANRGDWLGYAQALGDALQAPRYNKQTGKRTRDGLGIIDDDAQIRHWDGSRLDKDAANPRIEVEISPVRLAL